MYRLIPPTTAAKTIVRKLSATMPHAIIGGDNITAEKNAIALNAFMIPHLSLKVKRIVWLRLFDRYDLPERGDLP